MSGCIELSAHVRSQLGAVASEVTRNEDRQFERLLPGAASAARVSGEHWDFFEPARTVDKYVLNRCSFADAESEEGRRRLRRVAVARLMRDYFQVKDQLSDSITALYPEFMQRLAQFLAGRARYHYDEDYYAKDIRYALGLTVPCGALQLDLESRVGAKLILRDVMTTKSAHSALAYAASSGWGRWYSNHLDLRATKDFSPAGWTASFVRMAEILELNLDVKGVAGVSWFYDPAVALVSPHLAYMQTPTRHGAFLARMGTDRHHVENAIARSSLRRRLYEQGKYVPTCYLLAWPRRALIAWAHELRADPGRCFRNPEPIPRDFGEAASEVSLEPTIETVVAEKPKDHANSLLTD